MKQRFFTLTLTALVACTPANFVHADDTTGGGHVMIIAIQTAQVGATGNDFVEIYNPSQASIDVTGWKLQYRAAASIGTATWTTKRVLGCLPVVTGCSLVVGPQGHLVFSTYDLATVADEQPLSSGLSDVGGQLRLIQAASTIVVEDLVGYGTAAEAETIAAPAPAAGETLVRRLDAQQKVIDTNNNNQDFTIVSAGCYLPGGTGAAPINNLCAPPAPAPESPPETQGDDQPLPPPSDLPPPPADVPPTESPQPPADGTTDPTPSNGSDVPPPAPEPSPLPPATEPPSDPAPSTQPPTESPPPDPSPSNTPPTTTPPTYAPLVITELLPDPVAPATDDADEYIELFNPTNDTVDAAGYTIDTGATATYHYTLPSTPIAAGGYIVVMASQSHLVLANGGGAAQLHDPTGQVIDQTAAYGPAPAGQAWAKIGDVWQWTTLPTPTQANQPTPPVVPPEPPTTPPPPTSAGQPSDDQPASPPPQGPFAVLRITELLPDPKSPARDKTDEFIELYNPNNHSVNAADYRLETGPDFRYQFTIGSAVTIAAGGYVVIPSAVSKVPLSNSGTAVRLLDPGGHVIDTVASYGKTKQGLAWAKIDSTWQWTATPTPGAANKLTAVNEKGKSGVKGSSNGHGAYSGGGFGSPEGSGPGGTQLFSANPTDMWFVIPVAMLVVGYIGYEYRHNIARSGRRLWQFISGRRHSGPSQATQQTD